MSGNFSAIKYIFHQLGTILSVKQKKQAVGVVVVIIIGSAFELFGVTAILPFIQILLTPEKIMESEWVKPFLSVFNINFFISTMHILQNQQ